MFRTLSLDKAIGCIPNIIQHGTLFLSNDLNTPNLVIRQLIDELKQIDQLTPYSQKLDAWFSSNICVTDIWIGKTSTLVEVKSDVQFITEFGEPKPDQVFTIYPSSALEAIELNLKNIDIANQHLGSFDTFKRDYMNFLNEHRDSLFLIERIMKDITMLEKESLNTDYFGFRQYASGVSDWYDAFKNKEESLNLDDYRIWIDLINKVENYSSRNVQSDMRRLSYFLDQAKYVLDAAKGYSNNLKIPFLQNTRDTFISEYLPETEPDQTQPQSTQTDVELKWKGEKTDLAELVWALVKSGLITDTSTGRDVTQKVLTDRICKLLGVDKLDIANLMKGRYGTATKPTTFKAQDGKTLINSLQKLIEGRILD